MTTETYTFAVQYKKHYNYLVKGEEVYDNIYPMKDWTLEDHNMLWYLVGEKTLVFDIQHGGFVMTEIALEDCKKREEELYCSRCGDDIIRNSIEHDFCHINGDDDIICGDCVESCDCEHCEEDEACWWVRGKGGDKCWGENCGCSEGEEEEEKLVYDVNGKPIQTIKDFKKEFGELLEEEEEDCDDCEGKCRANETEECEKCKIKLRIGCANNPSNHSVFNGCCDDCREEEQKQQCRDCEIEAKKHCDECGGYGSEDE